MFFWRRGAGYPARSPFTLEIQCNWNSVQIRSLAPDIWLATICVKLALDKQE